MGWRTVAAALDAGTATCAALNAAYFLDRLLSGIDRAAARRLAVAALAIVSVASLVDALALLALAAQGNEPSFTSAPWAFVRLLSFVGVAGISALIARKWVMR
jgi:hypothetical protein